MKISNYFKIQEALKTDCGIENSIDDDKSLLTIHFTAYKMDIVRTILGCPIIVNSWYRNRKVNKAVGGSENSQHMKGEAVDFKTNKYTPKQIHDKIVASGISFDQLLIYKTFVHISFKLDISGNRKQVINKGGL